MLFYSGHLIKQDTHKKNMIIWFMTQYCAFMALMMLNNTGNNNNYNSFSQIKLGHAINPFFF